ncbi:hypothetical protein Q7A53_02055 [Halobacillus rhizosphaerae]|uniref:hypothetical protein n=1 Tax=Halobacillus rhizosphaerae TaxID=3064889 RepID=UPI00398A7DBC
MKKQFLLLDVDKPLAIVTATSEKKAVHNYAVENINLDSFRKYIHSTDYNYGLLNLFYYDKNGKYLRKLSDNITVAPEEFDIKDIDILTSILDNVTENIKVFWEDKPKLAKEYLNKLERSQFENLPLSKIFTDEFYIETFKKLISRGIWFQDFSVIEITNASYQQIFNDNRP